jgi:hypothetical protein
MTYIYESPDSGKTLYRRLNGTSDRELVRQAEIDPRNEWAKIQELAKTNRTLREAVETMLVIYHLSRDHGPD